jgi:hypothetical protein
MKPLGLCISISSKLKWHTYCSTWSNQEEIMRVLQTVKKHKVRVLFGFLMLAVGVVYLFASLPSRLESLINERWPKVLPEDRQIASIHDQYARLTSLPTIDLFLSIAPKTLDDHLQQPLMARIKEIKDLKIITGTQDVIARVRFEAAFPDLQATVKGNAQIHSTVDVRKNALHFEPTFSTLQVNDVSYKGTKTPEIILSAINDQLKQFLANINGTIQAQTVPVQLEVIQKLSPAAFLSKLPEVYDFRGKDSSFKTGLERAAILIDSDGIHLVAKLSGEQPIVYKQSGKIPGTSSASTLLKTYRREFRRNVELALHDADDEWDSTAAILSKGYIAGTINQVAARHLDLSARFKLPDHSEPFNSDINLDTAPALHCDENAAQHSCDIQLECSQNDDCNPHWNCPDCKWYDAPCHVRKAGCEADKARYRGQCELGKKAKKDACEIEKTTRKAKCEVEKEAEKQGCKANQKWLDAFSGTPIGNIRGTANIRRIDGNIALEQIAVNSTLSEIRIAARLAVSSQMNASFVYTPLNIGHLACVAQWGGDVKVNAGIPDQVISVQGKLTVHPRSTNGRLPIEFQTEPVKLTLKVSPPPIAAIIRDTPHSLVVCAPGAALGLTGASLSSKVRENLIKDTFEKSIPAQTFKFEIPSIHLQNGTEPGAKKYELVPAWNEKTIDFELKES